MKMTMGGFLVLAALFATGMTDVAAQQGRRGPQMKGMEGLQGARQDGGIESIMSLRERLELTEDQMDQLEAIRRENVQRHTGEMAEMTEVQSRYAAGLIRRSDVMAAMEDRDEAGRAQDAQQRERLRAILTEGQQESLNDLRRQNRASAGRGRAARGRAGSGVRGNRGGQQGSRAFRGDPGGRASSFVATDGST